MSENAYLNIKNPEDSRALKQIQIPCFPYAVATLSKDTIQTLAFGLSQILSFCVDPTDRTVLL